MIIELKVDDTVENAVRQMKEKKYMQSFEGKPGESGKYTGRILAVGIAYDRKEKRHECKVEVLRRK